MLIFACFVCIVQKVGFLISAFLLWTKLELENFVKIFKRHVFDSKSSMPTIAECVAIATKQCAEVSQLSMLTIAEFVAIATKQ